MEIFHMSDIIPLIGLPYPPAGRAAYNVACPYCDHEPYKRHLNINLSKNVFRCPRCGFSGGVFDLYAYYTGIEKNEVRNVLMNKLRVPAQEKKPCTGIVMEKLPASPLLNIDSRHKTYWAFLEKLSLSSDHKQNLRERGLSDEAIKKLGYKTMPMIGRAALATQLFNEGYQLAGVPGFYKTDRGQWSFLCDKRGILIPVRDEAGRIQGLQIRRDNVKKRKFLWVSSIGKLEGCKAEAWPHLAGLPQPTVLITEGPLKADVIHFLTGKTVLAVPGVNVLTHLERLLTVLRNRGTTKIMAAFDMDFLSNQHVQKGYNNLMMLLGKMGFQYGTYLWNPQYKGLDDYVWQYLVLPTLSQEG